MQGSFETADDTVDLLAGVIGGMIATTGAEVSLTALDFLKDLTRMVLGLFRSVGVVDVGLVAADDVAWVLGRGRHFVE